MRRFAALYSCLDASSGSRARVADLLAYFEASTPQDAAWAVHVLLGKQGCLVIDRVRRAAVDLVCARPQRSACQLRTP